MTQESLLEGSLPLYFQCLSAPVEWRRATRQAESINALHARLEPRYPATERDGDLLEVLPAGRTATTFDAWEKRSEFFRLKRGDTEGLLSFLDTVGLFGRPEILHDRESVSTMKMTIIGGGHHHDATSVPKISEKIIWEVRRLINGSMESLGKHTGEHHDFSVRIVRTKHGKPRLMLTTTTFLDALLLTLSVDQVRGAIVQKCARPDCGVSFSFTGGHKRKYCEPYCGHIESVRRQRRKAKRAQARGKSTLATPRRKRE